MIVEASPALVLLIAAAAVLLAILAAFYLAPRIWS